MSPVVSPKARRRHDSTSDSDSDDKDKESSSSPAAVQVKEEPGSPVQPPRNRADSGNSTQHKDTNRSNSSSSKSPEPIKRSTVTRTSGYGTYKRRENNGGARKESKERSWRYEHDDNRRPSSRSPGRSSVRRSRSRSAEKRRKVDDRADCHSVERRRTPERFRKRGSANDKRTTDKKDDTDNRPAASRSPARSPIRRSGTRSPDRRRRVDDRRSADRRRTPERFRKRGSPNGKRTTGEKDDKDNRPAVSRSPVNDQGDRRPADRRRSPERFRTRGSPANDKRTIDEKDNKDNRAAASRSPGRSPIRRSGTRSPDRRRRVDNRGNRRSADRKRTPERFRAQESTGGRRNTGNSSREKENRAGRTRYNRSASRDRDRPMEKRPRTSDAPTSTDGPNRGMELSDKAAEEWWKQKRKAKEATEAKADPQSFKSGGAYIPPAKLKLMQEQIKDKNSPEYQRLAWEQLKKRIHGRVNKANVGNLVSVVQELLHENVVRGKGLVARSIIQAQAFSPAFSHVYAALVAIINSKFPHIGELIARRLVIQFKRAFRRNDKNTTINVTKFIAHLVNQQVVHEVLALEMLILLLEKPTDDSVEVSIAFIKECGAKLTEVSPKAIMGIFDRLRDILHEGGVDIRVQYMIEVIMALRKEKFKAHPALVEELDLIEEDDQITHEVQLHAEADPENILNVFRVDADFAKNEETYAAIKSEILGDDEDSDLDDDDEAEEEAPTVTIEDMTETNLVIFRRTVYLTIQSSLSVDETVHKMLKLDIKPGMENELAHMILDCCAQQRTYEKFFGLLGERFCRLNKETQLLYEQMFKDTYDTIHRFDIGKLRNVTRMFAHLLHSDAITWEVLGHIKLNEDDTTSSGRIFLKIMFQELTEFQGLPKMVERIRDPTMQNAFDGIFPRDNPRNSRFSINFFTSIGLGGLTLDLREFLDNAPKKPNPNAELQAALLQGVVSSDDDSSDDDSSSSEEDEEEKLEREKKRKKVEKERKKSAKKAKKGHRSKEKRVKKEKTSKKSGAHKSRKGDVEKEERKKRRRSRGRS